MVCQDAAKKEKYIWIMLDAWASFQTADLVHAFNESSYYHILNTGYPQVRSTQSAAIHATQFVGRPSRNYVGGFLNDETAIDQLGQNAHSYFITTPFPVGKLLGSERFDREYIWDRREPYPFRAFEQAQECAEGTFVDLRLHGTSTDRDLTLEEAREYVLARGSALFWHLNLEHVQDCMSLAGIHSGGDNVLYYSFIMDSFNHNYGSLNEVTMERAAAVYAAILGIITVLRNSGLDEEYALFVSSDHGGQFFLDEDELCNHGCRMDGGNEAILYVYSKGTGPRVTDVWINTEDVGATVPQYVRGAGVPGTATGTVLPMFASAKYEYLALRSKEIQLLSHLNFLDPAHPQDLTLVMGASLSGLDLTPDLMTQFVSDYPQHLQSLQAQVEALQKPWKAYILLCVLILVFAYFIARPVLQGMELRWRDWASLGLLWAELAVVAVRNQGLGRVEKMIWWPVVLVQVGFLCLGLVSASDEFTERSKQKANVLRLLNVPKVLVNAAISRSAAPLSQLAPVDISAVVLLLYTCLLLTNEFGDAFTRIGETLYYLHYGLIAGYVLYDSRKQAREGHRLLWTLTCCCSLGLLSLAWYYEQVTDYSMSDQTEAMMSVIHVFYVAVVVLLLLIPTVVPPSERGRLIVYPAFLVYFFIASQQQRSHLLFFFIPAMEVLSALARAQDSMYLYCLLASQSSLVYLTNRGSYGFDISLRAGNHSWGTYPDEFPIFTGVIFGFHKMSWYHMVGAYIYRAQQWPISAKGWKLLELLVCRGLCILLVFMTGFYANPANTLSVFMWAMAQCSVMLFLHAFLIFSYSN